MALVRATCCNWDVPEEEIVFTETVNGETFTCCEQCSSEAIEEEQREGRDNELRED